MQNTCVHGNQIMIYILCVLRATRCIKIIRVQFAPQTYRCYQRSLSMVVWPTRDAGSPTEATRCIKIIRVQEKSIKEMQNTCVLGNQIMIYILCVLRAKRCIKIIRVQFVPQMYRCYQRSLSISSVHTDDSDSVG